jgi:hypothetical protein
VRPRLETLEVRELLSGSPTVAPLASSAVFSTYLGGIGDDQANAIAVDASGNVYITGQTRSPDFPITTGALQPILRGSSDAFVSKYSPDGALLWSTYLGGSGQDLGSGIAVDAAGDAYVTGFTASGNFPTTAGAVQTRLAGGQNAFLVKLDPDGSLAYSTFLGGSGFDGGTAVAVDGSGRAFLTGDASSTNFPTTSGVLQPNLGGGFDAFVAEVDTTKSGAAGLVYSTYLGGNTAETGRAIAVDPSGNAYVTGQTASANFPATAGAFQPALAGNLNAFVVKVGPGGTLAYATYLGGNGTDSGTGIAADASGNAYVTGNTTSTNFPTTPGALQTSLQPPFGGQDAFVTKLDTTKAGSGGLAWSTYLLGSDTDSANAITVDPSGNAYVTGTTLSPALPITPGAFQSQPAGAFVVRFNGGGALTYATYLGGSGGEDGNGIAVNAAGNVFVTGLTNSSNFPTTAGAQQATLGGAPDAFVTELALAGSSGGGGGGGGGTGTGGRPGGISTVVSAPLTVRQAATNYVFALDNMFLTAYGIVQRMQMLQAFFSQATASGAGNDPQLTSILLTLEQVTLSLDQVLLSLDQVTLGLEQVFSSLADNTQALEQVFSSLEQNTLGLEQVTRSLQQATLGVNQVTQSLSQVLPSLDQVTLGIDNVFGIP